MSRLRWMLVQDENKIFVTFNRACTVLSSALLLTCPCYRVTADRRSRECDTFVMVKCEGAAHSTSSQSHASLGSHPSVENILQISSAVSLSRVSPRNYCDCKFIAMSGFYLVIDCHRSQSGSEQRRSATSGLVELATYFAKVFIIF